MNNDDPMFLFKDKHKCCGFGLLQIPLMIVFKDREKKTEWVYVCSCTWTFMENRLIRTFDTNKKDLVLVAVHEVFFSFTQSSYIMTSRYKRYITYGIRAKIQRLDLMDSSTYRYAVNNVIWIWDIKITYLNAHDKGILFNVRIIELN